MLKTRKGGVFFFSTTVAFLKIRTRLSYNLRPRSRIARSSAPPERHNRQGCQPRRCHTRSQGNSHWTTVGTALRLPKGRPPCKHGIQRHPRRTHDTHTTLHSILRCRNLLTSGPSRTSLWALLTGLLRSQATVCMSAAQGSVDAGSIRSAGHPSAGTAGIDLHSCTP